MPINPLNKIKLLSVVFQTLNIPGSEVYDAGQQLADNFQEILIHVINEFNGFEIVVENLLKKKSTGFSNSPGFSATASFLNQEY